MHRTLKYITYMHNILQVTLYNQYFISTFNFLTKTSNYHWGTQEGRRLPHHNTGVAAPSPALVGSHHISPKNGYLHRFATLLL